MVAMELDPNEVDGSTPHGPSSPNKRKRPRERSRATRACDRCKRRKARCSGAQPCLQCTEASFSCTYHASYTRGRMPSIRGDRTASTPEMRQPEAILTEQGVRPRQAGHDPASVQRQGHGSLKAPSAPPIVPSSRVSPEPSQTDLQGHIVGPASGVSFLLRVQKRLHQAVSFSQASSIFTFGDAPLSELDTPFCLLVSREEGQRLLERYFDFAVPTHRFFHRPTIEIWLAEFFDTKGTMRNREDASARKAVLFMVFAQAQEYMPDSSTEESARYFFAAEQQLSKERGAIQLTSVQARLAQCYFLLCQSRINHCWSLFGTTAHLALAIGLNRRRPSYGTGDLNSNRIEIECRRRTFWCAYSLDNYLSAALGRPRTFHDDDIDQDLPSSADDIELSGEAPVPGLLNPKQSLMQAPVAHVRLSRIVSGILRDIYSIKPVSESVKAALALKHTTALKAWQAKFASFLDVGGINASLLLPIFQRQRNVLNFAYWHAMILTNRPFLLRNFARLQQQGTASSDSHETPAEVCVSECLGAAMKIVEAVDGLFQAEQMYRGYWFTLYFAFSAVVVLFVHAIQQKSSPISSYQHYLEAATRCQTQISNIAEQGSLTQRYSLVLEELRREAIRQTTGVDSTVSLLQPGSLQTSGTLENSVEELSSLMSQDGGQMFPGQAMNWNTSPSSSLADVTSWGQFDSLVTSGFGALEELLYDDSSRSLQFPATN
ncbi:transcriptional regulatory protein GAL4 [Xylariales sp. AK1849]|nr:transcriptional regulatory protein GAL4 [Xylariales sp. AK1849]